jgi:hypothetical protein
MARDSLVREAVRKTAVGRFDSGPCLFGAHAVDGRGRLAPGRVEARRLSPTFNGVVRVRVPPAGLSGGSSIGRALDDPVCAPTFARVPVVPGRRHRACGAGTGRRPPVTCLKNRNPPAVGASSVPAPEARPGGSKTAGYPGTGKASRFESCSLPSRRHGAAQPQSVRSELRLPDPTSARAATLQPHPHPPGRAGEPK